MPEERKREKCVICGALTPYFKDTPIDLRDGYVEGGGQTCPNGCEPRCGFCHRSTRGVDNEYLSGIDHLACVLMPLSRTSV